MRGSWVLVCLVLGVGPAWGEPVKLAASQRLGFDVMADAGAGWCGVRPVLRVVAGAAAVFADPELLIALQRVGASVVVKGCARARGVELVGGLRDGGRVAWRASALASEGWAVRVAGTVAPVVGATGGGATGGAAAGGGAAGGATAGGDAMGLARAGGGLGEGGVRAEPVEESAPVKPDASGRAVTIAGRRVVLAARADDTHTVLVDGRAVGTGSSDRLPTIQDARMVGETGYVLVNQPSNGSICAGGTFYLLLLRPAGVVKTADFGTCSEAFDVSVRDGAWVGESAGPRVEQRTRFSIVNGGSVRTQTVVAPVQAAGPAEGDVRTMLAGKSASDFAGSRVAEAAVRAVLPAAEYRAFRALALGGPQTAFERVGEWIVGTGCRAHECSDENFSLGFGPGNRAVLRWTAQGRTRFFGDPPAGLRAALSKR